jgi:hypothetical protein
MSHPGGGDAKRRGESFNIHNMFVEENQRIKRLPLRWGAYPAFGSQLGKKRLNILHREDSDTSYLWSSWYNEVSIDNRSAPCDKRNGNTEEPLLPGPLI